MKLRRPSDSWLPLIVPAGLAWGSLFGCLTAQIVAREAAAPLYQDARAPVEARVADLLPRLTLEEKVALCHGGFVSGGVPRLEISPLLMLDGRQGLRPMDRKDLRTTLLPCPLTLSCAWDETAAQEFGRVLAEGMLALGHHVLLAPMLNLMRSPSAGRNFENFGEDPFLTGRIGAAYIQGVQQLGVGACACLVVANDCEHRRHFTSSNMDDRTLRELHLLPYELAVRDGRVWSMMSGNNLFNGVHCAHNRLLLQELVKDEIGFDGVMITDWRAAYDTVPAALAGTDMTTGFCKYVFGDGLLAAVQSRKVPAPLLDEKVRRILRLYVRSGVLDPTARGKGSLNTSEHHAATRRLAADGIVLLKNEGRRLPLDPRRFANVLMTGPAAEIVLQGGGSGKVPAAREISPLEGLRAAMEGRVQINHLAYRLQLEPRLAKGAVEWKQAATKAEAAEVIPDAASLTREARAAAAVIFCAAGTLASEGRDADAMNLPGKQSEAIATLVAANPNVIVVLVANGPVTLDPWGEKVPAILALHYAGQAMGEALADVLTGRVNPSGKLSYTFGRRLEDFAAHAVGAWPARLIRKVEPVNPGATPGERKAVHGFDADYKEGVFAGYRWFDQQKIEPWYPFGHGLSYTTFALRDLQVTEVAGGWSVSCEVRNSGDRAGAEVVQVYVAPPRSSVPRPPRELKGFAKVRLEPGEAKRIEIKLRLSALAFYDVTTRKWKAEAGEYSIQVGNSSRNLPLQCPVVLRQDQFHDRY
jgi:beta-glucosidase